jgi:hypothetical protein
MMELRDKQLNSAPVGCGKQRTAWGSSRVQRSTDGDSRSSIEQTQDQGRATMEPRDYQAECLEKALKGNTIMCGDT